MYAVTGKLLSVDLDTKSCLIEAIPEQLYRQYLGGYGLGAALLLERMDRCDFPERLLGDPPLDSGETKGVIVDLQTMDTAYVEHEDLDPSIGLPSREAREALDLAHFLV